ncbi:Uu.00g033780.m01.CDS01 [Anthostomella pinea]|uniref:1-phosphatidylinositol-3-phosphate 5-kinase n=1 Tax=Anthostomella pinea TaxID=933095 RepID=A0AAI8V8Y1_9PEZI|nr:Uu.00g033780.m01.CDS01 [Anthostomella pinea]
MASKKPTHLPLSPSSVASSLPKSRRESVASSSVTPSHVDKDHLAQALDKIHTSAKERDVLTTFNDFAPSPDSSTAAENKGFTGDLVQNGISGLYSRFKEAVGVSGRDRLGVYTGMEPSETDSQDASSKKSSSTTVATPRSAAPPLPRADTGRSTSTFNSMMTDPMASTVASPSGAFASESHTQQPQSAKASFVTNLATSKSASSSRQSIPNMTKPTATITPVNVSAFREGPRTLSARNEEGQGRATGRKIVSSEGQTGVSNAEISAFYDDTKSAPAVDKLAASSRSRRDDGFTVDGNTELPISPFKASNPAAPANSTVPRGSSSEHRLLSPPTRATGRDTTRRPAVIDRIRSSQASGSHSRSSSISAEPSTVNTSAHDNVHHDSFAQAAKPQRTRSGENRISGTVAHEGAPGVVNAQLELMRKQVLSKDFWMADETCKECFLCTAPFTAFRRKHHCRTCGCIFDSRCTSIISGQRFGVQGTLRVCKPCLAIILQRQDGNASDDSADESYLSGMFRSNQPKSSLSSVVKQDRDDASISERTDVDDDSRSRTTPMMAIPATRRIGESSNRHSAVLEIDAPQLIRPSSSRSLMSMTSSRPQSSGQRRHHSKHNIWNRFKPSPDDRAPFRRSANEEVAKKASLSAFHDDNVIDPDLAPFMSDESSGDEQMSIMGTMAGNEPHASSTDHERSNFGQYLGGGRRNRTRTQAEKSVSGFSFMSRGVDELQPRTSRRRNLSVASGHQGHHLRSPRPKSFIMKGPSGSNETLPLFDSPGTSDVPRLTRSSSMKGDKKPRVELNPASLLHVRRLLRQLLHDADVPNAAAWEKALIPILLKCTTSVDPDIDRGDDIDIRHYVKLKKIPGGRPSDTCYVSGVIFTKKLALKSMARRMSNPRVVIVSFPIEYQRHQQHFMSLQPVIEQEREYLKQLVNRITALRPQLLLVEKSVSGLALQFLSEAKIAVAYNVKPSVLSAVSRCLETEIISSVDMLALPPHQFQTGKSSGFEVKTFVNEGIPGRKKTYIFLSSHQEELGCTIALRGAPTPVLAKLKYITEFMVYVVYNLKLESCLMRDSFIQLPTSDHLARGSTQFGDDSIHSSVSQAPDTDDRQRTLSTTAQEVPIANQNLSDSEEKVGEPTNSTMPRELLSQNIQHTDKLVYVHETHARASHDSLVPEDIPMPTFYSDMVAKYDTKILSASPFVKFSQPYLLMRAREQERRLVHLKRLRDQDIVEERVDDEKPKPQRFQLIKPEMVLQPGHKAPRQIMEVLHAVHDAEYDKALYNYQTQTRSWELYIQGNLDLFDPYAHQNIVVLHSVICTETKIPCVEPTLIALGFYDEHTDHGNNMDPDCTLGQYIEDVCYGADSTCTSNGCDRKMSQHHRTYVHGEARITVFIEQEIKGRPRRESIMMWSYCKVCKRETSEMEMSKGTWKYSFGKYLELSFWSRGTHLVRDDDVDGWNCPHDHHREHIRYFGLEDKIIRVHYDPIDLLEIIVPRVRITWKVEHDLNMKNEIFTHCQERWTRFTASVKARLKAIKLENILPEKSEACKAEIDRLTKKIQDEHASLVRKLQDKYMNSKYYEVIPFNVALREMLVKVAEWDAAFAKFETDFLPSDKDIRRLTMIQLRKMFTDESKESLSNNEPATELTDFSEKQTQASVSESDGKPDTQPIDTSPNISQTDTSAELTPRDIRSPEATLASAADATRGRVEPLDLATPKTPTRNLPPRDQSGGLVATPLTSAPTEVGTPLSNMSLHVVPTGPVYAEPSLSVTEQVEQLRRRQQAVVLDKATIPADSAAVGIPAEPAKVEPERGSSRRMGLAVSPPMVRALSQPVNSIPTLPRTSSAIGKKVFGAGKDKDRVTPSEIPPGNEPRKTLTNESIKEGKKMFSLKPHRKGNQSSIPRFVGKKDSRVSTIRKHFEQLSREFEKEREKDRKKRAAKMSHSRPFLQHSTTKAIVEVYQDVDDAVQEPGPIEEDQVIEREMGEPITHAATEPSTAASAIDQTAEEPLQDHRSRSDSPQQTEEAANEIETDDQTLNTSLGPTDDEQGDSDTEHSLLDGTTLEEIAESLDSSTEIPLELPKHDKMNFIKVLTNFWNERSASQWPPLDYPLNSTDHIFIDSDIIVREDEPSSVIAFALSSEHYLKTLRGFHCRKPGKGGKLSSDSEGDAATEVLPDVEETISEGRLENSLFNTMSSHYKYQFTEGSAKMLVKIFYAEQFDALRRKCGVADRIVESLSRCLKWDSKGGKTKSVFLKTQDDRMVMKSLSPIETAAFLKFAPAYFGIMAEALFHDLPSVIAKMLGFFQVTIKNPMTNTEIKLDLLLMENLFYDRAPTRIFDLKGSMRNRKIQSTGEPDEVLLDENMVEYIYESPLFAREHSKRLLRSSVFNDTLFLARQNVMDYSLMIAVDEVKKELVVGIIDCIRTYTWDKKLESWIKDRGFAGGNRNRPTVTSPKEYKSRFREAMARYILQAPNCWHQFDAPFMAPRQRGEGNMAGDDAAVGIADFGA